MADPKVKNTSVMGENLIVVIAAFSNLKDAITNGSIMEANSVFKDNDSFFGRNTDL